MVLTIPAPFLQVWSLKYHKIVRCAIETKYRNSEKMPKKTNIYYNRTNTCNICGEKGIIEKLIPHTNAFKEKDKNGNWTGRWTCKYHYEIYQRHRTYQIPEKKYNDTNTCDKCGDKLCVGNSIREGIHNSKYIEHTGRTLCYKCYMNIYRKNYETNSPNSYTNAIKPIANHRTGNLNPNCSQAKGDYFEGITSKARGLKILSIENDCYNGPLDHSRDLELGILETRGKIYNPYNRNWRFSGLENLHHKEFNFLIAYCTDKDMNIVTALLFPKIEIENRSSIIIGKNPVRGTWYNEYIIDFDLWIKGVIKYVY